MARFLRIGFVFLFLSCTSDTNTPENVLKEYMTLLSEGKCEEALSLETETYHRLTPTTDCIAFHLDIKAIICKTSGESTNCNVYASKNYADTELYFYTLKYVDGDWKIHDIPEANNEADIISEADWELGLKFINEYKHYMDTNNNVNNKIEWLNDCQFVSHEFVNHLQQMIDNANQQDSLMGLGYDPIFVAQDYPDKGFSIKSTHSKTNSMVVQGIDWEDFEIEIHLIQEEGKWLVDGAGDVNPKNKND